MNERKSYRSASAIHYPQISRHAISGADVHRAAVANATPDLFISYLFNRFVKYCFANVVNFEMNN